MRKRSPIAFAIMMVLALVMTGACSGAKSEPSQEPIRVYAEQLRWAYHRNEAAADAKYKGKVLEVTGVIYRMGKDTSDIPFVFLTDGSENMWVGVLCSLDKSYEDQLPLLNKWQTLTVWGRCDGKLYENVLLKNCSLSNPLPSTSEPTSSTSE
ncbi:MAG: hypothetical protein A2144_14195 [Chloroflexi bacterium RBG_16_50_9]|nr:MAG: hypothetical protein A2144_14195 [Chloroflexi bacterium RBG_16_50_9]